MTSLRALLFAATMAAATPAMAGDIRVVVTNLESAGGLVSIGLHGPSDDFPSPAAMVEGRIVPAAAGAVTVTFRDLPPGRYAVAVFHDVDGDGALDTGALGLPPNPMGVRATRAAASGRRVSTGPPSIWGVAPWRSGSNCADRPSGTAALQKGLEMLRCSIYLSGHRATPGTPYPRSRCR
ncbi:MAG: DUF2141 domain-containing protein [Rhodobacteraceae bacterium]|nr:DUF2141 domain-containing protein [Paracoccaceae bacterium]